VARRGCSIGYVPLVDAYHAMASYGVLALAALTFVALIFIDAPYGRHGRGGWGPTVPATVAWVLVELPAVLLFIVVFASGAHRAELVPLVLLGVWQLHYVHRTFIFPFVMPASSRRMPIVVMLMGASFQVINSWLNARFISELGTYDPSWLTDPRFVLGATLFLSGFAINLRSDYSILRMKREAKGYVLPRGGLFDLVAAPNYFGELVEWIGWALMTWSIPGLAFALYTFANLAPRALAHRRWYRARFEDYPPERRAIIPYVL